MRAMGFILDAKFDLGTQIYRIPVGRWPWSALATSSDRQWGRASLVEDRGSDPSILGALQEDEACAIVWVGGPGFRFILSIRSRIWSPNRVAPSVFDSVLGAGSGADHTGV